jgi:hypothetical protein
MKNHLLRVDDVVEFYEQPIDLTQNIGLALFVILSSYVGRDLVAQPVRAVLIPFCAWLKDADEHRSLHLHAFEQNLKRGGGRFWRASVYEESFHFDLSEC